MARHEPRKTDDERCCICLKCDTRVPYRKCVTCLEVDCPKCGATMVREGSPYHMAVMRQHLVSEETVASGPTGSNTQSNGVPVPAG